MTDEAWRIEILDDPEEFTRRGGAWVMAHAIDANVIGSVVAGTLTQAPGDRAPVLWVLVLDSAGEVGGVAMHRTDFQVFLPDLPRDAAERIAHELAGRELPVPGASGTAETVRAFGETYQRLTGRRPHTTAAGHAYVLDALAPPRDVPGERRTATAADLDVLTPWAEDFFTDTAAHGPVGDHRDVVSRRIAGAEVSLWCVDGAAVSMAAASPVVGGVARVNLVYTPPAERGRGYGAAVSAAVTRRALDDGADTCMLYADVDNPTSNGVYRRIGYRKVGDSLTVRFT